MKKAQEQVQDTKSVEMTPQQVMEQVSQLLNGVMGYLAKIEQENAALIRIQQKLNTPSIITPEKKEEVEQYAEEA